MKKKPWEMTDTELLDYLDSKAKKGMSWAARESTTGRGYRLHQGPKFVGAEKVRDAIRAAIFAEQYSGKNGREAIQ